MSRILTTYRDVLVPSFVGYLAYESTAVGLRSFQPFVVHGLLQTLDYARSLTRATAPAGTSQATVDRQIEARQARQTVLDQPGGRLRFIVDESVLVRPTSPGEAGERILRDQLVHLAGFDDHPRVTVQVLPLRCGVRPGLSGGTFSILEPQQSLYDYLVYRERSGGSDIVTNPHDVDTYVNWFEGLAAESINFQDWRAEVIPTG